MTAARINVETDKIKDTEYEGWYPNNLRNVRFFYDMDHKVNCGYGHETTRELMEDTDTGKIYDPHQLKGLWVNGSYKEKIGYNYTVIPDERVEEISKPLLEGRFDLFKKVKTHNGTRTFWEYISKDPETRHKIEGGGIKDDVYDVGIIIRNSINGGMSAGVELRTLRLVCQNGMLGWGTDVSSRIFHYGKQSLKLRSLEESINSVMEKADQFFDMIQKTTKYPATIPNMQYLYDTSGIGQIWMPNFTSIDTQKDKVLNVKGNHTVYDAINDITFKLTRSQKDHPEHREAPNTLSYNRQREFEQGLTKAITRIVKAKGGVPS